MHRQAREQSRIIWWCYFLLGVGILAPWNAFITATDYFQAAFPGVHVDRLFSVCYLPTCLLMLLVCVMVGHAAWLPAPPTRITTCYLAFTLLLAVVPLVDMPSPHQQSSAGGESTDADGGWHLKLVLFAVVAVGALDGACQGAVFSDAAKHGHQYTQAVAGGTACSGLLVSLLRLGCKATFAAAAAAAAEAPGMAPGTAAQDTGVAWELQASTLLYFGMGSMVTFACAIVYRGMLRRLLLEGVHHPHSSSYAYHAAAAADDAAPPEFDVSTHLRGHQQQQQQQQGTALASEASTEMVGLRPSSGGASWPGAAVAVHASCTNAPSRSSRDDSSDGSCQELHPSQSQRRQLQQQGHTNGHRHTDDGMGKALLHHSASDAAFTTAEGRHAVHSAHQGPQHHHQAGCDEEAAALLQQAVTTAHDSDDDAGLQGSQPAAAWVSGADEQLAAQGEGHAASHSHHAWQQEAGRQLHRRHSCSSRSRSCCDPTQQHHQQCSSPGRQAGDASAQGRSRLQLQLQELQHCWQLLWPFGTALYLTYAATLCIFPGFLAEDIHSDAMGDWYPLLIITLFNAADMLGKLLCPTLEGGGDAAEAGGDAAADASSFENVAHGTGSNGKHNVGVLAAHSHIRAAGPPSAAEEQQLLLHNDRSTPGAAARHGSHDGAAVTVLGSGQHMGWQAAGGTPCAGGSGVVGRCRQWVTCAVAHLHRHPVQLLQLAAVRGVACLLLFLIAALTSAPPLLILPATALLGLTNGWLTVASMSGVPPQLAEDGEGLLVVCLVAGLLTGALLGWLWLL